MIPNLAIFISGRGSNMQALVAHAFKLGPTDHPFKISLIISNNPEAYGLKWASEQNIPTINIDHKLFGKNRLGHEALINEALVNAKIDFIALAGYMRVLSPEFCAQWAGRMINIHPSLLPRHKGLNTHKRAIEAGDKHHGCTVHWVSPGVDEGAIIACEIVPVLSDDTEETLSRRVLIAEHKLYPIALDIALKQRYGV
jgi:phosphoribosylglycinamide formyltransferase 1